MPTYDYYCTKCEKSFDKILKIDDRKLPTEESCPNCNGENSVELLIGSPKPMNPLRVDGLNKPRSDFRERMQQIKKMSGKSANIKDY